MKTLTKRIHHLLSFLDPRDVQGETANSRFDKLMFSLERDRHLGTVPRQLEQHLDRREPHRIVLGSAAITRAKRILIIDDNAA